jgi:hypothetical protein
MTHKGASKRRALEWDTRVSLDGDEEGEALAQDAFGSRKTKQEKMKNLIIIIGCTRFDANAMDDSSRQ